MESRKERNKELVKEINHERNVKISKVVFKIIFVLLIITILIFLYMYFIGIKFININEHYIETNVESLYGIKILHFSDLLYGSTMNNKNLQDLEKKINLVKPDIVIFTGNLISEDYKLTDDDKKALINFLNSINPLYGKYAVYGNYDNLTYNDIMNQSNFILLDNQSTKVYFNNNDYLTITGLNTNTVENINYDDSNYHIALINNYDYYKNYSLNANLVLAGNNLGGEIKIPLIGGIALDNKYKDEYYQTDNYQVYISNGLGTRHHLRLFNHPSINIYRLY